MSTPSSARWERHPTCCICTRPQPDWTRDGTEYKCRDCGTVQFFIVVTFSVNGKTHSGSAMYGVSSTPLDAMLEHSDHCDMLSARCYHERVDIEKTFAELKTLGMGHDLEFTIRPAFDHHEWESNYYISEGGNSSDDEGGCQEWSTCGHCHRCCDGQAF